MKCVITGIQVGVCNFSLTTSGGKPIFIKSIQFVFVFTFFRVKEIQCNKFYGKNIVAVFQNNFVRFSNGLGKNNSLVDGLANRNAFIEDLEVRKFYTRLNIIDLYLIGMKNVKTIYTTENDFSSR